VIAPRKLLVLALDAASPRLLREWAAEGKLPHLAELLASGLSGDTRSVDALYVGATWPSFSTGRNPAGHGLYWVEQLRPGTYRSQRWRPTDFGRVKPLWEVLSDAGRRVAVLDVPLSRLSPGLRGMQLVEWGVHDALFGFRARPRVLARRILRRVGSHPAPRHCDVARRSPAEYRAFAEQLVRGAAARAELTRYLLGLAEWDFAIQVFSESHCAGHQLWHYHDSGHPEFDPALSATSGDLLLKVYRALDAAIGRVLAGLDASVTVVLLSLHGMAHSAGAGPLLPEILSRLGVMATADPAVSGAGVAGALRRSYRALPQGLRAPLYHLRQAINQRWLGRGSPLPDDPARSACFVLVCGPACTGIRLNLEGREPAGRLKPGPEAERFSEMLTRDLLDLVHPDSGLPLVLRVLRSRALWEGPFQDALPDLLVEWNLEHPWGTTALGGRGAVLKAASPRIGTVAAVNRYCRTGDHRIEGMFVARGPGLSPGRLTRVISNLDLAPSFARYLGCDMPGVDGRIIPELAGE
jgi:predicted AlkP superfamily phosphohydrolase/phosphomutase